MDEIESHESETVKKPKSWRRDLEAGEMTAVVASSHIHYYSSHLLAHSHDNHQRICASSTTSTARQRQTKCLLGDTQNLARLTPDTAKSTVLISLPRRRCHSRDTRPPHRRNTCSRGLTLLPGPYLHWKADLGVAHIRLGRHSPLHADNRARAL
jgi:hypothetical protein